eukprot:Sspe_Gene.111118::Locus_92415_Transcript_1_1_Confidence_1.000_Length_1704::g.111118::m.111118
MAGRQGRGTCFRLRGCPQRSIQFDVDVEQRSLLLGMVSVLRFLSENSSSAVHLGCLQVFGADHRPVAITSASNPEGRNGHNQDPRNVLRPTKRKWVDHNKAPLFLELPRRTAVTGYRFLTPLDHPEWDPTSWRLEGAVSDEGPWTLLHASSGGLPAARGVWSQIFQVKGWVARPVERIERSHRWLRVRVPDPRDLGEVKAVITGTQEEVARAEKDVAVLLGVAQLPGREAEDLAWDGLELPVAEDPEVDGPHRFIFSKEYALQFHMQLNAMSETAELEAWVVEQLLSWLWRSRLFSRTFTPKANTHSAARGRSISEALLAADKEVDLEVALEHPKVKALLETWWECLPLTRHSSNGAVDVFLSKESCRALCRSLDRLRTKKHTSWFSFQEWMSAADENGNVSELSFHQCARQFLLKWIKHGGAGRAYAMLKACLFNLYGGKLVAGGAAVARKLRGSVPTQQGSATGARSMVDGDNDLGSEGDGTCGMCGAPVEPSFAWVVDGQLACDQCSAATALGYQDGEYDDDKEEFIQFYG